VPTGKQNGFAAQNPPDFVLGVARQDGESWSLANAFEKPVAAGREGGYLAPSVAALDTYWGRLIKVFGGGGLTPAALALDETAPLQYLKDALVQDRAVWVSRLLAALPGR
jgi:CRISPR system Cascade subunit CasC